MLVNKVSREDCNWDDAFSNMAYVPDIEKLPQAWQDEAAAFRLSQHNSRLDVAYGEHKRQCFDLFEPDGKAAGLCIFIHGGYWLSTDKSFWSHLAAGPLQRGFAVAMPGYVLAPEARIGQMTADIGRAINKIAGQVSGPIHLYGHSAGGQLALRMVCDDSPLEKPVLARIEHAMSISGLHSLEPLMWTKMNDVLSLDGESALMESVVCHQPVPGMAVTAFVGGGERPEFIRQAMLLKASWPDVKLVIDGNHHHFSVLDGLREPASAIVNALLPIDHKNNGCIE